MVTPCSLSLSSWKSLYVVIQSSSNSTCYWILLKNIHELMEFMFKGFTIKTFKKHTSKAANLQEESKQLIFLDQSCEPMLQQVFERKCIIISMIEKGKWHMMVQPEKSKPQQPPQQVFQFNINLIHSLPK